MNHHNLAPKNLTKNELSRAEAEAHNAEMRRKMEAGQKVPEFEFPVESIIPQHGNLLVEMLVDKKEEGLIHIPASVEDEPIDKDKCKMMIIAAGEEWISDDGVKHPQKYQVGQEILPNPTGGRMLPERRDKRELMIFRQDEIMAVIDRSKGQSNVIPLTADLSPEN